VIACGGADGTQDGEDGLLHFLLEFICLAKVCFRFVSALPEVGKSVFIFQEPCPSWASHLF